MSPWPTPLARRRGRPLARELEERRDRHAHDPAQGDGYPAAKDHPSSHEVHRGEPGRPPQLLERRDLHEGNARPTGAPVSRRQPENPRPQEERPVNWARLRQRYTSLTYRRKPMLDGLVTSGIVVEARGPNELAIQTDLVLAKRSLKEQVIAIPRTDALTDRTSWRQVKWRS